jgi:hypothetical protein
MNRAAIENGPEQPFCTHDSGDAVGFGCPNCKRFEVRCHEVDCPSHDGHLDFACCWCGAYFFSLMAVDHDGPHRHSTNNSH